MAIIRTNLVSGQQRVITKGGRVSCLCCATECCYYNTEDGYVLGLWTFADLPDELDLWFAREPNTGGPMLEGPFTLLHNGDGTYGNGNVVGGKFVEFAVDGWISGQNQGFGPCGPARCLFTEDVPEGGVARCYVKDRFSDTYSITTYETFTITRASFCAWSGTDSNGCQAILEYIGSAGDINNPLQNAFKWVLSWSSSFDPVQELCAAGSVIGTKTGNQNGPTGTYVDAPSGATATISQ